MRFCVQYYKNHGRVTRYLKNNLLVPQFTPFLPEYNLAMASALVISEQFKNEDMKSINHQYEEAVKALNGLQSNAAVIEEIRKQRRIMMSNNLSQTQKYLDRIGITPCDLDKLPVIHIAGTKGKGSTCAFIESILREHGLKTGFYSSPHLVAVRERIRINGIPIAKREFSESFWDVYNKLTIKKSGENDMPAYFKFLTVLAFKIFLKEDVDVAIMEVGIGGEFDCTNVLRQPIVCGITSLDIDHTNCLGDTIEEISWHKGGIIKPRVPVFTVSQQPPTAMSVLLKRASEKQSKLFIAPPLENYGWQGKPIHLGLSGYVQFLNASLALQLSRYFLKKRSETQKDSSEDLNNICGSPFVLSEEDIYGLENVVWPGRSQVLVRENTTFFLDGAHTPASIQSCIDWYDKESQLESSASDKDDACKILVFNLTGDRDHEAMLAKLFACNFDVVIFTTNLVSKNMNASSDQTNFTISDTQQISRCERLQTFWQKLNQDARKKTSEELTENEKETTQKCLTFQCIRDVLLWISCGDSSYLAEDMSQTTDNSETQYMLRDAKHIQVLITGSLHLVGGFLAILDPSLSQLTNSRKDTNTGNTSMADLVKREYLQSRYSTPGAP